jgi:copper chaperone CopZ
MLRRTVRVLLLAAVAIGVTPAFADEDVVEVTVTGEGLSKEAARNDALRKALEQGGKAEIFSHSQVENFELIKDTIYSRAEGIVTDYKILEESEGMGGTYVCKILAKVSKSAVASTWGAVQNVLDQIGRPGVMVLITEKIDGVVDNSSILESKIEEKLIKAGFDVYAGEQVRAIAKKEAEDAAAEDNIAKMQAIAKDFGTQIFVTGAANANAAGVRDLYGEPTAMYNGDCVVKMFYTDTGRLLASESLPSWRGGARGIHTLSPQAGKMALSNAGEAVVEKVYNTVMKQWATQISAGGDIRIEVEGVNVADAIKIKKKLEAIPGIEKVHYKFTKGIATYRIVGKMTAESLTEQLVEGDWAPLIEIVDVKLNRIQAKKPGT